MWLYNEVYSIRDGVKSHAISDSIIYLCLCEVSPTIECLWLNPDGRTLAVATDEEVIRLWDIPTGKVKTTLTAHGVNTVTFSPDGTMLASGSGDPYLWDVHTGKLLHNIVKARGVVYRIAFSPDGKILASGSLQTIELWNTFTAEHIGTFTGYLGWIEAIAFSPDGKTLASGNNGTVILWDMNQIPD